MLHFPATNLRTPGPTPLPRTVLAAMAQEPIAHRGAAFHALYDGLQEGLCAALATNAPCLLVGNGGTGAMEAAVHLLPVGTPVAVLSTGTFGHRFVELARRAGLYVYAYEEPGDGVLSLAAVEAFLATCPATTGATFFVACETSTGVMNDPTVIVPVIRVAFPESLVVVDTVSLSPVTLLRPDDLGIDVLVVSSTKAMMGPPGLGILVVGARAQAWAGKRVPAPMTLDVGTMLDYHEKHEVPFTPPVHLLYGLQAALDCISTEGRDALIGRHCEAAERTRQAFADLGICVMALPTTASSTVTCGWLPLGIDAHLLVEELARRHGVVLATGRDAAASRAIRLAHMGHFSMGDIDEALAALRQVLLPSSLAV